MNEELSIEERVLLLALLKREPQESVRDILLMLENSRVFTLKEGKRLARKLRKEGYLEEEGLTFKGITAAQAAEAEFKL
ncbi:hypothetical protein [Hydrogenimonas sp. SS33]|uniref:hypothetical protein n=1 Tax=Hydrogenimonas leucolamina TaxID=2954236 RepID=UPI00336BFE0D